MLGPGRGAKRPRISDVKELGEDEVGSLVKGSDPVVKRLRDSHHRIARLFAAGLRTGEVADVTGYSLTYVSRLKNTPIMEDLILGYHGVVDEGYKEGISDYYGNMVKAREMSARMIVDQLVEADEVDERLPLRQLLNVHDAMADRTGYGKGSTQLNVNVDWVQRMDRAIEESNKVLTLRANGGPNEARGLASHSPPSPRSLKERLKH